MTSNKQFVILSGPACVGKGPLQAAVRKFYPGLIDAHPVLCTSRPPRKNEIHGKDYYFLPESFIRSLEKSSDFIVSPVRTDWQAIHLSQIEELLRTNDRVFAEVFYTFGPVLLERAATRQFENTRIFLLPLPYATPAEQVVKEMKMKLNRRGTDSKEKIDDRASSAPNEIEKAMMYTHRIITPVGEDDISEWKSLGTYGGGKGQGEVNSIEDLGPNAKWLVQIFVEIVKGKLPPGDYSREMNTTSGLEHEFDMAMMDLYHRAKTEARYNATRYLQMLEEHRGLETARILLHAPRVSDGYTALWERKRLDLTVEALILQKKWHPLFSDQERDIARKRLEEYKYEFKK